MALVTIITDTVKLQCIILFISTSLPLHIVHHTYVANFLQNAQLCVPLFMIVINSSYYHQLIPTLTALLECFSINGQTVYIIHVLSLV